MPWKWHFCPSGKRPPCWTSIVAPATPFDYVGLFNSAERIDDPVLVIEHHFLYQTEGELPDDRDYCVELGKAKIARQGSDLTIVAYSYMVRKAMDAASTLEHEGISAEVIDLRSVDYPSIDYAAIGASLAKSGRLLIAEEGMIAGGLGAEIACEVQRRFFDLLDAEIERVAGPSLVMAVSSAVEARMVPSADDVAARARSMVP